MNQFEELLIAAHTDEGRQARKLILTLKRAVVEYMQQELSKRVDALEDENSVLKDQLKPRGHFLYLFKNNRDEPDDWCYMKAGSAKDVDARIKPYLQISPKGAVAMVIEIPVKSEKELQNVELTIHRFLRYSGYFLGVSDRAESYLGDIERVKQIIRVLVDLFNIISQGQNWDTLQHMVALCNEELRDAPVQNPSSEPLALSEIQVVRQHLQELVTIKSQGAVPVTNSSTGASIQEIAEDTEVEDSEDESNDEEEAPSKAYDFKRFVDECCEKGKDFKDVNVRFSGRHKVWSRCRAKDLHRKLIAYMKTKFCSVRFIYAGQHVHGFAGVRLKPTEIDFSEVPTQAQEFFRQRCVDAPQGKLFDAELQAEFADWRGESTDVLEAELREVHKLLRANYPHYHQVWAPHLKDSVAGFYGVSIRGLENRFIRRFKGTTAQGVCMIDVKTNRIKRRWEKVADAAKALGLCTASISYSIQNDKLREGCILRYARDIADDMDEDAE